MPTHLRKLEGWTKRSVLRTGIMTRVSSDLQNPKSPDDQERDCLARIIAEGWQHVGTFHDREISGATEWRDGYQRVLAGIGRGEFDIVIAESLGRISRDQEDSAAFYKRACFAEVTIFTLAEGEIEDWHVGVKAIINAAYLQQLANETRRGLHGRVLAGASAGGLSYGYDVVHVEEGEKRGGRTINVAEAAVVVRIFELYAKGVSPHNIAAVLNRESVPAPRAKYWSQSTINGNRKRGTGILNNELYHGYLVWNRLRYVKDPDTDKRRSRSNPPDKVLCVEVPLLRIVTAELWDAVRVRQAALDALAGSNSSPAAFQKKQRPTYLLSGLMRCGVCGGGMSVISATHVGCSNARNKGDAVCANRRTVKREVVEATVLDALRMRLMSPDNYAGFVRGFTAEWNRDQGTRAVERDDKRAELKRLARTIGNLVAAIGGTGGSPAVFQALKEAEARQTALKIEIATAEAPAPRLMPNLAELYREKVAALHKALAEEDGAAAREQVRALIDEVRIIPSPADPKAVPTIEVRGQLAAMLALGSGKDASAAEQLEKQMKLVAGAGFEPAAFRL